MGLRRKGEEKTLRKPLPTREVQKGGNREVRKKNTNARKNKQSQAVIRAIQ